MAAPAVIVNDVHAQLNATRVEGIVAPRTVAELRRAILLAGAAGIPVSIAGGRHSMGGQQFGEGTLLIDTRALSRVVGFDPARGHVTLEGGIQWPALLDALARLQQGRRHQWGIVQKQTGADRLSLAGALSCNAHGRGLTIGPIVQQVESFDLMDHAGTIRTCSRTQQPDLFRLAIGGYGLFGVITQVTLRLQPRVKVRRVVDDRATRAISLIASIAGFARGTSMAISSSRSPPTMTTSCGVGCSRPTRRFRTPRR